MKNQAFQYLAFDVHQATTVATVRDEHGAIRLRATVPTEASAILGLVRGLGPRVHVAFEEGTQAQWLHDLLGGGRRRSGEGSCLRSSPRDRPLVTPSANATPAHCVLSCEEEPDHAGHCHPDPHSLPAARPFGRDRRPRTAGQAPGGEGRGAVP
jgi:hypothetical protein